MHDMTVNTPPVSNIARIAMFEHDQSGKNSVIGTNFIKLDDERTWISPTSLGMQMIHMLQGGFIVKPPYMNTHVFHASEVR